MSIRRKAWRNAMVATINEALDRRLFSLEPDGVDLDRVQIAFDLDGTPATAEFRTIGWDEIAVHVTQPFKATGWLERRNGKWLQDSGGRQCLTVSREQVKRLAEIEIEPKGYADRGQFFL